MNSLTVSLSDNDREFVEAQVAAGGYESPESYIRGLIRADQNRRALDEVETLLLQSLKEPATEMTEADWARLRLELEQRIEAQLLEGMNSPAEDVTPQWWDRFHAQARSRTAPDATR